MRLGFIRNDVERILRSVPEARNSDNLLYAIILQEYGKRAGVRPLEMSVGEFLRHHKSYGLPTIESVGRCRRKVQEEIPELRADKAVADGRFDMETEYIRFGVWGY